MICDLRVYSLHGGVGVGLLLLHLLVRVLVHARLLLAYGSLVHAGLHLAFGSLVHARLLLLVHARLLLLVHAGLLLVRHVGLSLVAHHGLLLILGHGGIVGVHLHGSGLREVGGCDRGVVVH